MVKCPYKCCLLHSYSTQLWDWGKKLRHYCLHFLKSNLCKHLVSGLYLVLGNLIWTFRLWMKQNNGLRSMYFARICSYVVGYTIYDAKFEQDDQRWFILSWIVEGRKKKFSCFSTFDKRVPSSFSSWYQFTHVWSISVTEDERNFFHYGWHQWHPGKYVLDKEFLLIPNVNQFLSEDQSKVWWSLGHHGNI